MEAFALEKQQILDETNRLIAEYTRTRNEQARVMLAEVEETMRLQQNHKENAHAEFKFRKEVKELTELMSQLRENDIARIKEMKDLVTQNLKTGRYTMNDFKYVLNRQDMFNRMSTNATYLTVEFKKKLKDISDKYKKYVSNPFTRMHDRYQDLSDRLLKMCRIYLEKDESILGEALYTYKRALYGVSSQSNASRLTLKTESKKESSYLDSFVKKVFEFIKRPSKETALVLRVNPPARLSSNDSNSSIESTADMDPDRVDLNEMRKNPPNIDELGEERIRVANINANRYNARRGNSPPRSPPRSRSRSRDSRRGKLARSASPSSSRGRSIRARSTSPSSSRGRRATQKRRADSISPIDNQPVIRAPPPPAMQILPQQDINWVPSPQSPQSSVNSFGLRRFPSPPL